MTFSGTELRGYKGHTDKQIQFSSETKTIIFEVRVHVIAVSSQ